MRSALPGYPPPGLHSLPVQTLCGVGYEDVDCTALSGRKSEGAELGMPHLNCGHSVDPMIWTSTVREGLCLEKPFGSIAHCAHSKQLAEKEASRAEVESLKGFLQFLLAVHFPAAAAARSPAAGLARAAVPRSLVASCSA